MRRVTCVVAAIACLFCAACEPSSRADMQKLDLTSDSNEVRSPPSSIDVGKKCPAPPAPAIIAGCFGYPGELQVEKLDPSRFSRENRGKCLSATAYKSGDRTFAETEVVFFQGGTRLTDGWRRQFKSHLAECKREFAKLDDKDKTAYRDVLIRAFRLPGDREAYAYLEGFGAGAQGFAVSWSSPRGNLDLQISIAWGNDDGGLAETATTKDYGDAIQSQPLEVLEKAARAVDKLLFVDAE